MTAQQWLGLYLLGVALLAVYLIPSLVAGARHHHNGLAIFMLNFLLGWTAIGWVVALIWACTTTPPRSPP